MSATFQKATFFIFNAVKTPNPIKMALFIIIVALNASSWEKDGIPVFRPYK
jgi:hypothetical protein